MTHQDWAWVIGYLLISIGVTWLARRHSGRSVKDYFSAGGGIGWGLVGLSMVATTFSADTPLAVTGIVRTQGVSGNWLWWNMLIGGTLTTFFFARYWRRVGVLTDLELISLRYSGPAARWLRKIKAVYFGFFINLIIMAWVNVAMRSVLEVYLGFDRMDATLLLLGLMLFTAAYVSWSGLRGVIYTDAIQFVLAMTGSALLAYWALQEPSVGGLAGIREKLGASGALNFLPSWGSDAQGTGLSIGWKELAVFVGLQWWASWYPGAEPGGGGYIAQRMISARDEGSALKSILLFQFLHYAGRPLPWIITGLATLLLYPSLEGAPGSAYLLTMRDLLPASLSGLMLVAFLAAYMSTLSTHLNWGASYIINDWLYADKPKERETKRSLLISQATIFILIGASAIASIYVERVENAWKFLIECGAGAGGVLILRWFWWRISAYSEIAATVLPFLFYGIQVLLNVTLENGAADGFFVFPNTYFITVIGTTAGWLIITMITPPTQPEVLAEFEKRAQPAGWWPKATKGANRKLLVLAAAWIVTTVGIICVLTGAGQLLLGSAQTGWLLLSIAGGAVLALTGLHRRFGIF